MHDFTKYTQYTMTDIIKAVQGIGMNRKIKFRYDILNNAMAVIGTLADVSDAEISCDNTSSIKKSIKLSYRNNGSNFISNKLRPVVSFLMPNGQYLDFPQGVYIMGGTGSKENGSALISDITLYDEIKRLDNEKTDYRYFVAKNSNYTVEIRKLINKFSPYFSVDFSTDKIAIDREWDIGTSYLTILNDLLRDINYDDIWTDERGIFRARKKVLMDNRASEYSYSDDLNSIQFNGVEITSDYFSIPNKWIVTATNPESLPLVSTLVNQDDINVRKQILTRFETLDYIASKSALDEYVSLLADSDKVTETIKFDTALVPFHDVNDTYMVYNSTHGIGNKYTEINWTLPMTIGLKMQHTAIRKVTNFA